MQATLRSALLASTFLLGGLAAPGLAQTATLADGRVLSLKTPLELFITEGPIWDINTAARSVTVTGKTVTIPATVNGTPYLIGGTAVTNAAGAIVDGIGAHNFDRLLDENAVGRDVTALQAGAVRSLFSTTENLRQDALRPVTRNASVQQQLQANYFATTRDLIPLHPTVLAPDFGSLTGFLQEESAGWVYPNSSGGTFKSAGHVYLDASGNRFLIPDEEAVIELAENVAGGVVTSVHPGGNGIPPSFTMGNLLVVFNQDPRFAASTIGLVGTEIPRSIFLQQAVGQEITVVGYMVSEHVLFANEVETSLTSDSGCVWTEAPEVLCRARQRGASQAGGETS